jgi:hypothetical protein
MGVTLIVGAVVSTTEITDVADPTFPESSVAVNVIVFCPIGRKLGAS